MRAFSIPVRRPVATLMTFAALGLLGTIAWFKIPVELFPAITSDQLSISFNRPGSEAEVVEREILVPLEGRISALPDVEETNAEIRGSSGWIRIRFSKDSDIKVRELDLRRVAADLAHSQPQGTFINVGPTMDTGAMSRFVMVTDITAPVDRHALRALIEERIEPRLAGVPGMSRVMIFGGSSEGVSVFIDPERTAALGLTPDDVTTMLARNVRRSRYVGGVEDESGRAAVFVDGMPGGVDSLATAPIRPGSPAQLHHLARIKTGAGREESLSRVNGQSAVTVLMFKKEGANLVRLGEALRTRIDELQEEFAELGVRFEITVDGAKVVSDQILRLKKLAASGFLIALLVLFLFLRQVRAVLVVVVSVPASLLIALALLYLSGQTLNLITLFGLAVGLGMLVDNAIVVYEAVQRQLERGATADDAAEEGVRRTARAIVAATATNAIVFLPLLIVDLPDSSMREILGVLALAYLLPLLASLLVALGLVPLLARYLAAPAAVARLKRLRKRRGRRAGLLPPDRGRELFGGLINVALHRPGSWLAGVAVALLITAVVTTVWLGVSLGGMEPPQADQVRLDISIPAGSSLQKASAMVERLEQGLLRLDGIERVQSFVQEENASLTVQLVEEEKRPAGFDAATVRARVRKIADQEMPELEVHREGEGQAGGSGGGDQAARDMFGGRAARVVLSGPDAKRLQQLARDLRVQLKSISEIDRAWIPGRSGQPELRVSPDASALLAMGLLGEEILPALQVLRREGVAMRTGMVLEDGREVPLTVYREEGPEGRHALTRLRISTRSGVVPLGSLADVREMPPPTPIVHHNGRRELTVNYRISNSAPQTGPARDSLEARIRATIQQVHRPNGYTIETPPTDESMDWFKMVLIPVALLLLAVLAITFESLVLPLLVLVALPLTLIGATWSLVLTGTPLGLMVFVGALALLGLTVNPAILLVDRMQERMRGGFCGAGGAAFAAVRERTRPVLMTTVTTVAGLWPLALATGQADEIWPPFATVVMGGLAASTVLTLLVIPVGFVLLRRLDSIFGRIGPWVVLGWLAATAATVTPLFWTDWISSLTWRLLTTFLVAGGWLMAIVLVWRRESLPEPEVGPDGAPEIDIRFLHKTYGKPGPIGHAWRAPEMFARRVLARGGRPFDPADALAQLVPIVLLGAGALYLVTFVQTGFWRLVFIFVATGLAGALAVQIRRARGKTDSHGRVDPGGPAAALALMAPWVGFSYVACAFVAIPELDGTARGPLALRIVGLVLLALVIVVTQWGRRTARRIARGEISERVEAGRLRYPRSWARGMARRVFGMDLPREEVPAVVNVDVRARRGMVGVLGPNGAGKTTLLRLLAGILEPSRGQIFVGGVPLGLLRRHLARWVGYLPQDFGLPKAMTAREYLDYFALLYEIGTPQERRERVERLLTEVGLVERADEKIGGYSGGMRQRVAIARTLLRLPAIIIVDEPTVGLDPRERIRFRNLLTRLAEGRIVLFSTHVVEDVAVACERVLVMARGRVVYDGSPADLAHAAADRSWKLRIPGSELPAIDSQALITDQVPEADGSTRLRILAASKPHEDAEPVEPTLEDGYLVLVSDIGQEAKR